jgi:hypothetical protein
VDSKGPCERGKSLFGGLLSSRQESKDRHVTKDIELCEGHLGEDDRMTYAEVLQKIPMANGVTGFGRLISQNRRGETSGSERRRIQSGASETVATSTPPWSTTKGGAAQRCSI